MIKISFSSLLLFLLIPNSLFGYIAIQSKNFQHAIEQQQQWSDFFWQNRVLIYKENQNYEIRIDINNLTLMESLTQNVKLSYNQQTQTQTTILLTKQKNPKEIYNIIQKLDFFLNTPIYIEYKKGYYTIYIDNVTKSNQNIKLENAKILYPNAKLLHEEKIDFDYIDKNKVVLNPSYKLEEREKRDFIFDTLNKKEYSFDISFEVTPITKTKEINITEFEQAKLLYSEKKYSESLSLFEKLSQDDLTNSEYSFYIGLNYFGLKLLDEALAAYDRVLIINPDSVRTELEIAKIHFLMKKFSTSEGEFKNILKRENLPQNVITNINNYLALIEKYKQNHFFNGTLIAGVNYDSNVNNYEDTSLQSAISSSETVSDFAHQEILILNYKYRINDNLFIKNDSMVFNKMLFTVEEKNIFLASNNLNLEALVDTQIFNLGLYIDTLYYGTGWLMEKLALYPKHTIAFNKSLKLNTNIKYEKKISLSSTSSISQAINANYFEFNSNLSIIFNQMNSTQLGMLVVKEDMSDSSYSNGFNYQLGLNGTYTYKLTKKLNFGGKFTTKYIYYYKIDRIDRQYTPAISANYLDFGLMFSGNISYMINDSTSSSNSYNKFTTGVNVILPF